MGKMTELIRVARKYVGYDYRHFCNAFSGGCWAWCAAFVSVCAEESGNGAIIPWSTSCNEQIRQFKEAGVWLGKTQDIRVGDILYYDWDHIAEALPADHVGIVIEDNGDTVKVIEGNKGDAGNAYTTVGIREIPKNYSYIYGIARPVYETTATVKAEAKKVTVEVRQLEYGMTGKDVEAMQAVLMAKGYSCGSYGSDGDFGGKTLDAVKNLQSDRKITVDGICGAKTWAELLNK